MASFIYTGWKGTLGSATSGVPALPFDALKVILLTSAYTPDQDAHVRYEDISANEYSGTGYTTGGVFLTNAAWVKETGASVHRYKLTADPTQYSNGSFTARYAAIYDNSTSAKYLVNLVDFGRQYTTTSAAFQLTWDSNNGVINFN